VNQSRRKFIVAAAGTMVGAERAMAASQDSGPKAQSHQESHIPRDKACDYSSSYVTFVTQDETNFARLQVESRCLVLDQEGKLLEEFFQYASCKAEDTHGEDRDLFQDPNYDFSGIFSREHYAIYRCRAPQTGDIAERGPVEPRFQEVRFQIRPARNVQQLDHVDAIIKATLQGLPLVGRTEICDKATGYRAIMEYPVKTINVRPSGNVYQVDTGPVAFPDFDAEAERLVDRMELSYVAYNRDCEAHFIILRATPVTVRDKEVCRVCHYSEFRRMPAKNVLMSATLA